MNHRDIPHIKRDSTEPQNLDGRPLDPRPRGISLPAALALLLVIGAVVWTLNHLLP